ncbi:CGNR zinc finger domain-containing protein [Edaphobacter sp.]|uniref:CGNR zinc finger domain-containing protein n=1 Tax=Edaphobacter sp. TaxID=1934404 RepID=UPI002D805A91|nr:CGNR zinc finger domain-containing protein [Edaphobacter sp.]
MLADHPALDFMNTVVRINGELIDLLQTDDDVLRWLAHAGWPVDKSAAKYYPDMLLEVGLGLRAAIQGAIKHRKAGEPGHGIMNGFLYEARNHLKLIPDGKEGLRLERQWDLKTPEEILGPLIVSAAELLVDGDFSMIKHCENPACVLWFYDRTRAHRRRWCSMATCGTRNKVATFRQREQENPT